MHSLHLRPVFFVGANRTSPPAETHNSYRNFSRIGVALIAMGYIALFH
jgi:hypothetical protein